MTLWLSALIVSLANCTMKASGPLALGNRPLPPAAVRITGLLAPVLVTGLIVVDLGGAGWSTFNGEQTAGVAAAGVLRAVRAPLLMAVVGGVVAAALLRHLGM